MLNGTNRGYSSRRLPAFMLSIAGFCAFAATSFGQERVSNTPPEEEAVTPAGDIDERAEELLRTMCRTIAAAKQFSFRATGTEAIVDEETGKIVHFATKRSVALARPDRLRVEEDDGYSKHRLWFDAGRLTLLDAKANLAAIEQVPATIDAMLDSLFNEHGLVMPLSDLLFGEPYAVLSKGIERGMYLGEAKVAGRRCHHLAFREESLDWQVWVDAEGEQVLPRKVVLTYTGEPGHPQFTALFSGWDLAPEFAHDHFDAALPTGVERVGIAELTGAMALEDDEHAFGTGWIPALLLAAPEPLAAVKQRRRGGGRRGGGAHRMQRSSSHRGSVRPRGHGSVGYSRASRSRGRSTGQRTGRSTGRSTGRATGRSTGRARSAGRTPAHRSYSYGRRGASGRAPSTPGIQRTPGHGSLRNRANVNRSFADRQRHAARRDVRALRDVGGGGGGYRDYRDVRRSHLRRRALGAAARRYRWGTGYYWYDGGHWWEPYYNDDEVEYVETYPAVGIVIDDLPDDAEEVDGGYYELNGVYYESEDDGTYAVVAQPDSGMPDPVTIVQRACDFVSRQSAFTIVSNSTMDHVQDDGQKIQSATDRTIHVQRPDKLAAMASGDDVERSFWYDGKQITIVDALEKVYARTPAPPTIDDMIDFAIAQLGLSLPITDLLYDDPYAAIKNALQNGEYLGLADVDGVTCHHLSFSTSDADWQLWVDSGKQPAPVMLVITYTGTAESPTYRGHITGWDLDPEFDGKTFVASIPDGLEKIEFTTPLSEVNRIEDELDEWREANRSVADYIAAQRTVALFGQIAEKPGAAEKIEQEKARMAEIGDVSQEQIDAYLEHRDKLRQDLTRARQRAARDS